MSLLFLGADVAFGRDSALVQHLGLLMGCLFQFNSNNFLGTKAEESIAKVNNQVPATKDNFGFRVSAWSTLWTVLCSVFNLFSDRTVHIRNFELDSLPLLCSSLPSDASCYFNFLPCPFCTIVSKIKIGYTISFFLSFIYV